MNLKSDSESADTKVQVGHAEIVMDTRAVTAAIVVTVTRLRLVRVTAGPGCQCCGTKRY